MRVWEEVQALLLWEAIPMSGTKLGRLKARVEGDWWVFRYELEPGSERELGRVSMDRVASQDRATATMRLFAEMTADLIGEVIGARVEFDTPTPAPANERAGRA